MKENQHIQAIPPEIAAQAKAKIQEARALLAPYMLALTPEERRALPKMGDKTFSFVEKVFELGYQSPHWPPFIKWADFEADFRDAHDIMPLHTAVIQMEEELGDTEMAAGSEAYQTSLVYYHFVKVAAEQDVPGARAIYEELKERFPGGKRGKRGADAEARK